MDCNFEVSKVNNSFTLNRLKLMKVIATLACFATLALAVSLYSAALALVCIAPHFFWAYWFRLDNLIHSRFIWLITVLQYHHFISELYQTRWSISNLKRKPSENSHYETKTLFYIYSVSRCRFSDFNASLST